MQIVITPDGHVRCLYDEALPLTTFGRLQIQRGAHVEPVDGGLWTVDLSPVNGPLLGPFISRSVALAAEVDWLNRHWLVTEPQTSLQEGSQPTL